MSEHYIYKIVTDTTPESPREFDNLGTMACWHRRMTLGDIQPTIDRIEHMAELIGWDSDKQDAVYQFWFSRAKGNEEDRHTEAMNKLQERVVEGFGKQYIWREVYAYQH